jgi:UDP:flavonoid glycosyltransferase YjiC (YdhE family)
MRLLFTCVSGYSHFYSMVPLAVAARECGQEVAFSSALELAPVAEAAEFPLLAAGPGRLRMRTDVMRRYKHEVSDDIRSWETGARMFGDIAPALRWRQLSAVVESYRPDVVISEALELAGPLVAKLHGLPHVFHSLGPYYADSIELLWERAAPLYRRQLGIGVTLRDVVEPYLDVCPPALQTAAGKAIPRSVSARLRAYHGVREIPPDRRPPAGPRVLITFGTVSNDALHKLYESAAELGRSGLDVLITLGPRGWFDWSWSTAGDAPAPSVPALGPNVHTVDYVPLDRELPTASVLIHHGGSNTTRAAIEFGVPMLVIPQGAEQYRNARTIADRGLGQMLLPAEVTPAAVTAAVSALLAGGAVAERVAAARTGWLAMPDPADAVAEIERKYAAGMVAR